MKRLISFQDGFPIYEELPQMIDSFGRSQVSTAKYAPPKVLQAAQEVDEKMGNPIWKLTEALTPGIAAGIESVKQKSFEPYKEFLGKVGAEAGTKEGLARTAFGSVLAT